MGREKTKKNSNIKYIAFLLILLILATLFFLNMFKKNQPAEYSAKAVKGNISFITHYDYSSVRSVESQIKILEDSESVGNFDVKNKLGKNQYRRVFGSSIVLGDSITEGLSVYGYLGSNQVFCGIGASVMHGDDLFTQAAKTYPKFAFLSFGMNDMGNYTGHADLFIAKYTKMIRDFKQTSPDTHIYVNSISKPSKAAIANNSMLGNYKKFNNAMKEMCSDLKIKYIDNTYILEEHPELYAGDGIHVASSYYPLWLNNMILKAGL